MKCCLCVRPQNATSLIRGAVRKTQPEFNQSPRFAAEIRRSHVNVQRSCLTFSYQRRTKQNAVQNDGVQLRTYHERGEQHRGSQRTHHAVLLQTGESQSPAGFFIRRHTTLPTGRPRNTALSPLCTTGFPLFFFPLVPTVNASKI